MSAPDAPVIRIVVGPDRAERSYPHNPAPRALQRECGTCNLCCKVLNVDQLQKPANTWCQHAVKKGGCAIYDHRPGQCQAWSCLWLGSPDATPGMDRPDKAKYVIDEGADVIKINGEELGVMVVWADPGYPRAWRHDARLKDLIEKLARRSKCGTLVRIGNTSGWVVLPPEVSPSGKWHEQFMETNVFEPTTLEAKRAWFANQEAKSFRPTWLLQVDRLSDRELP